MSKKGGRIAPILKDPSSAQTTGNSLLRVQRTRTPGAKVYKTPFKELNGKYRTGLDPEAIYIDRIADPEERKLEIEKVTALKSKLEKAVGCDLSPTSEFWNTAKSTGEYDTKHARGIHLSDEVNDFSFLDPFQEIAYNWLRVHPTIASSMQAYRRGEFPHAQFYVVDDTVENKVAFDKKREINKAIIKFDSMSPTKRKQVGRGMGLPITDETSEEEVYKLIDDVLKQTEFKSGAYKGMKPVNIFNQYADMDQKLLDVKDLIKQLVTHNVLRYRNGAQLYKGEVKMADNDSAMIKFLMNDDNQGELIALEKQLTSKKLQEV